MPYVYVNDGEHEEEFDDPNEAYEILAVGMRSLGVWVRRIAVVDRGKAIHSKDFPTERDWENYDADEFYAQCKMDIADALRKGYVWTEVLSNGIIHQVKVVEPL